MKRIVSSILILATTMSMFVIPAKANTVEPTIYADTNHFEIDFAGADLSFVDLNKIKLDKVKIVKMSILILRFLVFFT